MEAVPFARKVQIIRRRGYEKPTQHLGTQKHKSSECGQTGYERQKHPIPALTPFFSPADTAHNDLKQQPRRKHHCVVSFETRKELMQRKTPDWLAVTDWSYAKKVLKLSVNVMQ